MSSVSKSRCQTRSKHRSVCALVTDTYSFCGNRQQDIEAQQLYAQVPAFYDFLQNRVLVTFKPKPETQTAADGSPEFELMLSKKMTYDLVSRTNWNILLE